VAVRTQFGDQHARPPPLVAGKRLDLALYSAESLWPPSIPATALAARDGFSPTGRWQSVSWELGARYLIPS
jgi:hypothetical protein